MQPKRPALGALDGHNQPKSLLENVKPIVEQLLGVTDLRHISALLKLAKVDGEQVVEAIYQTIAENYRRSDASANKDRSRANWRWQSLQPQISSHNRSAEVVIERAIASACCRLKREDWANQVPVSSGLIPAAGDGRRAIDLVRRLGNSHFELIELKIRSDTPLFAAIEIIVYGCLWLIARNDKPTRPSALLDADNIDLCVLAPAAYYARYSLGDLTTALDAGVRALGKRGGVKLSFTFKCLDDRITAHEIPDDQMLLDCLGSSIEVVG